MIGNVMVQYPPPMSNTERQRQFRERNPGYYGRYKRQRNAKMQAQLLATQDSQLALPAPLETTAPAQPILLMLPAPAPAFNPVFPALEKLRETVPVTNVRAA